MSETRSDVAEKSPSDSDLVAAVAEERERCANRVYKYMIEEYHDDHPASHLADILRSGE